MQKKPSTVSVAYMVMGILFCVCLIASNLFATKQISILGISLTGGLLVFPLSYIVNDCVSEVWGYKKARLLIWTGFVMNFFFVIMGFVCDIIPGASYYENEAGFHAVFGLAPRIAIASFCAFLAGSFLNAIVMSKMKVNSQGRHFSWRAILSTIVGEGADSIIFFPLALGGVIPNNELLLMMVWQVVLKTVYEILILPFTIHVVKYIKKHEGIDTFDTDISYNPLKIKDL